LSGRGAGLTSKSLRSARALPRAQGLRQHVEFDAFSSVPGPTLQLARENARGIAGGREMRALKAGSASIRSAKGIRTADRAALCPEPWSRRAVVAGEGLEAAVGRDRGACAAVSSCACGDPRLLADPGSVCGFRFRGVGGAEGLSGALGLGRAGRVRLLPAGAAGCGEASRASVS